MKESRARYYLAPSPKRRALSDFYTVGEGRVSLSTKFTKFKSNPTTGSKDGKPKKEKDNESTYEKAKRSKRHSKKRKGNGKRPAKERKKKNKGTKSKGGES